MTLAISGSNQVRVVEWLRIKPHAIAERDMTARKDLLKPSLRSAAPTDARQLAQFERGVFINYYAAHRFSEAQFRYYLNRSHTMACLAQAGREIVGYVL